MPGKTYMYKWGCPACGAKVGDCCRGSNGRRVEPHAARRRKMNGSKQGMRWPPVHEVSGGHFEGNRSRH